MKKLLFLLAFIPTFLFGQTPPIYNVLGAGNNANSRSLIGLSLVGLRGSSSGTVTVQGPAVITTYTFVLPPNDGTSGQVLTTDGNGVATWETPSSGLTIGSTAISGGTNPYILYNNAGVLGNLQTIPIANGGTNNTSAYTAGSVIFSNGTSLTQDNSNFFWNDANNRLGVGTNTIVATLGIQGSATTAATYAEKIQNSSGTVLATFANDGWVNIGATSPAVAPGRLNVTGTGTLTSNYDITLTKSGESAPSVYLTYNGDGSGGAAFENTSHSANVFSANNLISDSHDYFNSGALRNFGVGTVSPPFKITANSVNSADYIAIQKSGATQATIGFTNAGIGGYFALNNDAGNLPIVQFNVSGTNDYFKTGNNLDIIGSKTSVYGLNIQNTSNTGSPYTTIYFGSNAGTNQAIIGLVGTGNSAYGGAESMILGTNTAKPIVFIADGGAEKTRMTANGAWAFGGASNYGSSGQILTSAGDASPVWTSNGVSQQSYVAATYTTSSTTLANVTGLTANVSASGVYRFEAVLHVDADAVGGHKYRLAGTATATSIVYQINSINNGTNAFRINSRITDLGTSSSGEAVGTAYFTVIKGEIVVNGAGTITVQFAQNTASGTSSVVAGSTFSVTKIQ